MLRVRSLRIAILALSLALASTGLAAAGLGADLSPAGAASPNRAAVIVDTGGEVHRVVITFTEDSISGIDALQRAGGNPVIYTFGGQGGAICRVFGVGRDAGPNCLGGQDGDNRYWGYFRAPAGTSGFSYSSIGAGASRVHDGDVEGWKFATGGAPAYVSLASLLPPPTTAPTTRPPAAPPTKAPAGGTAGAPGVAPSAAGAASAGVPTSSTLPVTGGEAAGPAGATTGDGSNAGTGSKSPDGATKHVDGKTVDTALASSRDDDGGGSGWSLLWFAALLLVIVAAVVVIRRARQRSS